MPSSVFMEYTAGEIHAESARDIANYVSLQSLWRVGKKSRSGRDSRDFFDGRALVNRHPRSYHPIPGLVGDTNAS